MWKYLILHSLLCLACQQWIWICLTARREHWERRVSRLRWFETFAAHSELYQLIANSLISMRKVGSIGVELRVKALKDTILTKKRNTLGDNKAKEDSWEEHHVL